MPDQPAPPSPLNFPALDPAKLAAATANLRGLGILFFILGFIAVLFPAPAGLVLTVFTGWCFVFVGVSSVASAFAGPAQHHPHRFLTVLVGLIGIVAGLMIAIEPLRGLVALTIVVAAAIAAQGVTELIWASKPELAGRRGWLILSGVAGVVLGGLIFSKWPYDSEWFIGLLFGIKMLFTGATLLSLPTAPPPAAA